MANKQFGKLGDIWKHLPLADVLSIEQPEQYWESHAGSAQYELTHCEARDYGIFHFLDNAHQNDTLADSAYFWLSSTMAQSEKPTYPGSPGIAMATLNPVNTRFLFCDTDQSSLDSIVQTAQELDGPSHSVKTMRGNGLSHIRDRLKDMSFTQANNTFLLIDPYTVLESDSRGMTALDLFCQATLRGVKTMLWFGSKGKREQTELIQQLHQAFFMYHMDMEEHRLWLGQIHQSEVTDVYQGFNPGIWGCALLCANLCHNALATCAHLGQAVEQIYTDARFPDNTAGKVSFSQTMFHAEGDPHKTVPIISSTVRTGLPGTKNETNRHTESLT